MYKMARHKTTFIIHATICGSLLVGLLLSPTIVSAHTTYSQLCSKWISSKLQLKLVPKVGWGYFAGPEGINPGDDLVNVPFQHCIESLSTSSTIGDNEILDLVEEKAQRLSGDGMEVRLAALVALAPQNNTYVEAMFSQTNAFPEPLHGDILETLLVTAVPAIALRAKRYHELAHIILSTMIQLRRIVSPEEIKLWSDRIWKSFFLVTSRSFMLQGPTSKPSTVWMVPCADLFNHRPPTIGGDISSNHNNNITNNDTVRGGEDDGPSARFFTNLTTCHVVIQATKHVSPGEEVFISYGAKTNADLFLLYGFVIPENRFDLVFLDIDVKEFRHDPNYDLKMKILSSLLSTQSSSSSSSSSFAYPKLNLGYRGLDAKSLAIVRMLMLPPSEFSALLEAGQSCATITRA